MKLDREQRKAVETNSNNVIVVASAGSGKTRVLVERVRYLLNKGVPAHNIVCITFTNIAADEMKERLKDVPNSGDVFIGTIHGFASSIYKESGIRFRIRNSEIEKDLYKEALNPNVFTNHTQMLTFERYLEFLDVIDAYDNGLVSKDYKNNFLRPSEAQSLKEAGEVVDHLCKERGIIDFDELLEHTSTHFKSIGASLEYLLVDEFQDIGRLESTFLQRLDAKHNFFVGDDWQAIYSFRGGNVGIFKKLMKSPEYETHYLVNNYRNSLNILEMSNKVISQVDDRIDKETVAIRKNEGSVSVKSKMFLDLELDSIKNNKNYGEWFILTRTNRELFAIAKELESKNIPYDSFKRDGMTKEELNAIMQNNSVKLLTVHVSKGLENNNVILYGNFPLVQPKYRLNKEERRVMYVGMTRAKDKLVILN